jgi:hypothetical protein
MLKNYRVICSGTVSAWFKIEGSLGVEGTLIMRQDKTGIELGMQDSCMKGKAAPAWSRVMCGCSSPATSECVKSRPLRHGVVSFLAAALKSKGRDRRATADKSAISSDGDWLEIG